MSLQAYQRVQANAENPRDTEYRLFGQVVGALMDARGVHKTDPKLIKAIDWNRRLWNMLSADCSSEGNQLPKEVRAQIISIGIWVQKYSRDVMRIGADVEPLIDVNKSIMQGLEPK